MTTIELLRKRLQKALLLIAFMLLKYGEARAQVYDFIDTSVGNRDKYLGCIAGNNEMVMFLNTTLLQHGLPKMLSNLALIESGFEKNAFSNREAGGIWQLTVEHAADYNLADSCRFDVYKSTQVAVKTLRNLYQKYDNWIAVVAAYNCGEGNLNKAISKAGSRCYTDYARYLPNETVQHVKRFMEACFATNDFQALLFDYKYAPPEQPDIKQERHAPNLSNTEINSGFDLNVIAEQLKVNIDSILKWNPGINKILADKGYALLFLPTDAMSDFQLLKTRILQASLNTRLNERSKL